MALEIIFQKKDIDNYVFHKIYRWRWGIKSVSIGIYDKWVDFNVSLVSIGVFKRGSYGIYCVFLGFGLELFYTPDTPEIKFI